MMEKILEHMRNTHLQARLRRAFGQFWKYCLVGASGFVINLLVFWLMLSVFNLHYLLAATISFAVAVTNNFVLNKYWTFGNPEGDVISQAGRFAVISVMSWILNLLILRLLIEDINMDSEIVAQAIAVSMVTVLNFSGNKLWSFRQPTVR
jgi:putative flippase GtrA